MTLSFRMNNGESKQLRQSSSSVLQSIFFSLCSYKHAIDGVIRVYREEGFKRLFSGASTATGRATLMTIGQLSFYDQFKILLIRTGYFEDNLVTHFTASLSAVIIFDPLQKKIANLLSLECCL